MRTASTSQWLYGLIIFIHSSLVVGIGNSKAPRGGTWKYNLSTQPTTLNVLSSSDRYASIVQSFVVESLGERNVDTYEWEPALATSWKISKDGLSYTFKIREGVRWQDGKPFTVEDIKFTFDAIVDPKNTYKTAHARPYYENIGECQIVDKKTVRFTVKKKYFANFDVVAGMDIVPRHLYEKPDKKMRKKLNKTLVGTGPYRMKEWKRGKYIKLAFNKNWWGKSDSSRQGMHNYSQILMRFVKDGNSAIQYLQKGDLDYNNLTAEEFVKKTKGPAWGKKVFKVKYKHDGPKGYGFIAWNLKNEILKDRKVRLALYHLIDRQKMIDKFNYGFSLPATGPWYQQSIYADSKIQTIPYSPSKALQILKQAGWKDSDKDGVLDKIIRGKKRKLRLTILEPSKEFRKYLVVFQQDAKKAGVDIQIKLIEWNAFLKLLDERKFESVRLGWSGGSVDLDPKQIWHSSSYARKGSNFIGYSNKRVDELIDKARITLEREKRIPILQEVYRQIAYDVPYAFLFNSKYGFYGHTKRMKREKDSYKFDVGTEYWWIEK